MVIGTPIGPEGTVVGPVALEGECEAGDVLVALRLPSESKISCPLRCPGATHSDAFMNERMSFFAEVVADVVDAVGAVPVGWVASGVGDPSLRCNLTFSSMSVEVFLSFAVSSVLVAGLATEAAPFLLGSRE